MKCLYSPTSPDACKSATAANGEIDTASAEVDTVALTEAPEGLGLGFFDLARGSRLRKRVTQFTTFPRSELLLRSAASAPKAV